MHFFNYYGYYSGSFIPREVNLSGDLLIKQAEFYLDIRKRLEIAKEFVRGACHNLKRNIEKRGGFEEEIKKFEEYIKKIDECDDLNSLMSVEAHFRKLYYSCIEQITPFKSNHKLSS